ISIGSLTRALGNNATALGYDAYARAASSLALGDHADAQRSGSVALGSNSIVSSSDDPSLGAFLTTQSADHIVSIGPPPGSLNGQVLRRIPNVAGGVGGNEAVNGHQPTTPQSKVAPLVGGGSTANAAGDYSGLDIGSTHYQTIAEAIQDINGTPSGGGPGGTYVQYNAQGGISNVADAQATSDAVNL